MAGAGGGPVVVMTFDPHPLSVLRPDVAPAKLTPLNEKLLQLSRAGADAVVVVAADREFLALDADAFVERIVMERLQPRGMVEGPSFRYGRERAGDTHSLEAAGRRFGFEVAVVEPVEIEILPGKRESVSSSWIRETLYAGNAERAARALGRAYAIEGRIVEGRGRGRELGFATANVAPGEFLIPREGVYAAGAEVAGQRRLAAVSIGRTPTFQGTATLVEAHLLDFADDVYGQTMRLEFLAWVRPQRKFDSAAELAAQIRKDVAVVRESGRRLGWQASHGDP
jgi:riboflavin kinase/FMN adenylyltransferase